MNSTSSNSNSNSSLYPTTKTTTNFDSSNILPNVDEDIQMLEHGLFLLQHQLTHALQDLNQLHQLKHLLMNHPMKFIQDLRLSKLDIPALQNIIHVPSLEWLLSKSERPPSSYPVTAFQPIDFTATKDVNPSSSSSSSCSCSLLSSNSNSRSSFPFSSSTSFDPSSVSSPFTTCTDPSSSSSSSTTTSTTTTHSTTLMTLNDPTFLSSTPFTHASSFSFPSSSTPLPSPTTSTSTTSTTTSTTALSSSSPSSSSDSKLQSLMEKKKLRAARERERRRRKKELALLNGHQSTHIGPDGARISGVHYLQMPTTFMEVKVPTTSTTMTTKPSPSSMAGSKKSVTKTNGSAKLKKKKK